MKHFDSALEKYAMQDHLPEFAMFPSQAPIPKGTAYYNSKEPKWNRPAYIQKKFYPYYHQQNDENKERIAQMKAQQIQDVRVREDQRKEVLIDKKFDDRRRFEDRRFERIALESQASQPLTYERFDRNLSDSNILQDQSTSKRFALKRAHIKDNTLLRTKYAWNEYSSLSKKHLQFILRPGVIRNDEVAIESIQKKIEKERSVEELRKECFERKHDEIRAAFIERHEKNLDFQKKIGLVPNEGLQPLPVMETSIQKREAAAAGKALPSSRGKDEGLPKDLFGGQLEEEIGEIEGEARKPSLRRMDSPTTIRPMTGVSRGLSALRPQTSSFTVKYPSSLPASRQRGRDGKINEAIEKLSKPKEDFIPMNSFDHDDFRGLLLADIDERNQYKNNLYVNTLMSSSNLLQKNFQNLRTSRPSTMTSMNKASSRKILSASQNTTSRKKFAEKVHTTARLDDFFEEHLMDDVQVVRDEIAEFERVHTKKAKKVGYPRIALDEAKSLTTSEGFKALKANGVLEDNKNKIDRAKTGVIRDRPPLELTGETNKFS